MLRPRAERNYSEKRIQVCTAAVRYVVAIDIQALLDVDTRKWRCRLFSRTISARAKGNPTQGDVHLVYWCTRAH